MSMEISSSDAVKTQGSNAKRKLGANISLLLCLFLLPEVAMANPITDAADWVLDLLTNGLARTVAIIAIVIMGYLAWAGRITSELAIKFVVGLALVFGGAAIVDLIIAAVSTTTP